MPSMQEDIVISWTDELRQNGFKITEPRLAVIQVLATSEKALNATQIFDSARDNYSQLGLVSIYRTLEILEDLDLIQRVHQKDSCHTYIAGFQGHQHLLICEKCGKAEFFEGDNLAKLFDRVAEESGFSITDHWLQLFGVCPNCKNRK